MVKYALQTKKCFIHKVFQKEIWKFKYIKFKKYIVFVNNLSKFNDGFEWRHYG